VDSASLRDKEMFVLIRVHKVAAIYSAHTAPAENKQASLFGQNRLCEKIIIRIHPALGVWQK